ncbi:uncharacterized protein Z519_00686 [Cladophialophora bantiana CBS 173.52]|uniref:Uncharacterized protein n=1 Tax=Cladophialophora bantiana (strain ATCC 10958 / CBS 173.52 / CDC B-1940 / NIH 8579) TaxID=1442370 RepID=A0A0D2I012_CLAB1|nr:uncharacterized protein Z519_00686 [Cladophialophora bantiana CBS 173.52]KIW99023.1 hypothetical protein Z519_00686 [Cladophialophora bantiana CBS 173.52]
MATLVTQYAIFRRFGLHLLAVVGLSCFLVFLYRDFTRTAGISRDLFPGPLDAPVSTPSPLQPPQPPPNTVRQPCIGPRGRPVQENLDDRIWASSLDLAFPEPVGGSYAALDLPLTFNTPESRYGPYGYGEESEKHHRVHVQWSLVNWADLQNDCLAANQGRFHRSENISTARRFGLPAKTRYEELKTRTSSTGRTAIVLRSWEGYNYTSLDLYHLRSLIVEAGLDSNADNAVFLLVDMKDKNGTRRIFHDSQSYEKALQDLVPAEFRDIAVLFNRDLLESWYPRVPEHSAFFQVYQPLQLFAQLFPDFDHYWQLEMDMKFTGNSGQWLDAMARFARKEPRKQSVERSSYYYMPQIHGPYEEFRAAIDKSLGGGGIWGPVRIPDIRHPIGPQPPVANPREDNFDWGVGEDADLILTNALADVRTTKYWPFKGWIHGFQDGEDTPRFYSPVAMGRYSWNLLNAMHHAQVHQGLSLPSEATAVSFALYHGLKVVFPPHPWFHHPQARREVSVQELGQLFNGGTPAENVRDNNGLSFGKAMYDPNGVYELFNGGTWWWVPGYPGRTFKQWMNHDPTDMPSMLREDGGKIWAPILALHPVKSGANA